MLNNLHGIIDILTKRLLIYFTCERWVVGWMETEAGLRNWLAKYKNPVL